MRLNANKTVQETFSASCRVYHCCINRAFKY